MQPESQLSALSALRHRERRGRRSAAAAEARLASVSPWASRLNVRGVLRGHTGCVNTATWSGDAEHAITSGDDLCVVVHRVATQKRVFSFDSGHDDNVFDAKLIDAESAVEDGARIVTCARDGAVAVHTVRSAGGVTSHRLHAGRPPVFRVAVVPQSRSEFYFSDEDGGVWHHDLRSSAAPCQAVAMRASRSHGGGTQTMQLFDCAVNPVDRSKLLLGAVGPAAIVMDTRGRGDMPVRIFCPDRHPWGVWYDNMDSVTGVAWSAPRTGARRLVASISGEHIYTFDLDETAPKAVATVPFCGPHTAAHGAPSGVAAPPADSGELASLAARGATPSTKRARPAAAGDAAAPEAGTHPSSQESVMRVAGAASVGADRGSLLEPAGRPACHSLSNEHRRTFVRAYAEHRNCESRPLRGRGARSAQRQRCAALPRSRGARGVATPPLPSPRSADHQGRDVHGGEFGAHRDGQ